MPLSLSVFSQSGPPICTPIWAFFRAFKALRALKGPLIKFSHILMHRPYRDILNLKFSCLYLFPFSHKVVTKNRLRMVSKVRNVRLGVFSGGGCHHPKSIINSTVNLMSSLTALCRSSLTHHPCCSDSSPFTY